MARNHDEQRAPVRRQRALRAAEVALAALGGVCLVAYAVACARTQIHQERESEAFDRALRERLHAEAPDTREWSAARVAKYESQRGEPANALARLEIPEAGVSVMVLEGTDEQTLDRAVGLVEGTARPGERGNVGIAGHRDGWFRGLRHLQRGDAMSLTTLDGVAHYEVESIRVVTPRQVEVLAQTEEPTLTLVTCYPFYFVGDAPERFIVQARQVSFEPWPPATERVALQEPL